MLTETLKSLLNAPTTGCIVHRWVVEQGQEIQDLFEQLKQKPGLNLSELFRALTAESGTLPFGKTVFTYHMRGECSCQQA